ncbi:sigma-70 family RNA polymerase sigma factor [Streptomyces griseomycini]|uniref:RNA polymerase sigma factor (Sigma-70 family) n=1 Tax=Streptomyces griseomycini TaxID=66895 RepID=A0A7W7V7S4_9ACTN|nr:sigma-70 family RNA polymerase sigma factor [Streptomyces griseomycini]MBB4900660.1 RNA polymerase sigma factor (sigma-70 family) [Streptomyces griseomycini]GGQ00992.1 RNA polymerase sigma factor [Streptomyces griseomycini]GGR10551.1 RNA polymerase sigma factor [Streptomyces griseomycini]
MTHVPVTTHDPVAADLVAALRPLLAAEAAAEAPGSGAEPGDLEQAVWLRLLERLDAQDPPRDPRGWLRRAVRAEVRRTRRAVRREAPLGREPADGGDHDPERLALAAARRRDLRDAVRRLPGRCPRLMEALLSPQDPTYREIAGELGISQGSLGPERSRCLGCLRRLLTPEVAAR